MDYSGPFVQCQMRLRVLGDLLARRDNFGALVETAKLAADVCELSAAVVEAAVAESAENARRQN